ncbi:MAG: hypothetical protein CMB36_01475 [Euryarchaeota archaeon]|nr:hypothetical protein [Euryarchaeota archaeon]
MASDDADMFAIRPDHKGPKTVAILLIVFSIFLGFVAKADLDLAGTEQVSDAYMEQILETPNQQGDNVSFEEYQSYHQEVNNNNGYLIRGVSLAIGSVAGIVGGALLYRMKPFGGKLALVGALISFVGGIVGNMIFYDAAQLHLRGTIQDNAEYFGYACGICTFFVAALALLPLINARARLAFAEVNKVELLQEESE